MEVIFPVERILKLASCLKLVKNGKPAGERFFGGACFIEPVKIDQMCADQDVKIIRKAKLKKIKSFTYHHSTIGYKGKYLGPKIEECIFAVIDNLSSEELSDIYKNGGAFSVKQGVGLTAEDMENLTTPVVITVYKDKSGKLPADIANQNIKYKNDEYQPCGGTFKNLTNSKSLGG